MKDRTMNILVSGANGQLGMEIRKAVQGSSDNYIFTDVNELDITDAHAVSNLVKSSKIDIIVNCAAYTKVDGAEDAPALADKVNRLAAGNLAAAAKEGGACLIHFSTDYVFKGDSPMPLTEDDEESPASVYGATKLAGEREIMASGCNCIILRTSWLYSAYGNNFVKTMLRLASQGKSLKVVFDQTGTPTYAGDLAFAVKQIIDRRMTSHTGIYHYSNEGVCSWYDLAHETLRLAGVECNIVPCRTADYPARAPRPCYTVFDKRKFKETFGIEPPYWRDSLAKCINEILAQQK